MSTAPPICAHDRHCFDNRLEVRDDEIIHEERLLEDMLGRIRDVRSGPDGYIYLLTDEGDGVLARLEPA